MWKYYPELTALSISVITSYSIHYTKLYEPKDFCKTFVFSIQFFHELVIIFRYDKTFEGLLTAVFDAYNRKTFPEKLIGLEDIEPLFTTEIFTVISEAEKSGRVWAGLDRITSYNVCYTKLLRIFC